MLTKSAPVKIKAGEADGIAEGQFEAIVSVFGNVDSYGDVVVKGAFADDIAAWAAAGDPIPMYWSHRMDDPDMNIGHVLEAKETDEGLWVRGQLDLEAGGKAAQVYRLMKGRRVTQFSFAYDIVEAGWAKSEELGEYFELRRLKVHEVGPTPVGANQATELLDVKSLERLEASLRSKAGRVLSAKNEAALQGALTKIADGVADVKSVLSALEPEGDPKRTTPSTTSNDSKATASEPGKAEDRPGAPGGKAKDPMRCSPVDLSALHHIELDALASTEV